MWALGFMVVFGLIWLCCTFGRTVPVPTCYMAKFAGNLCWYGVTKLVLTLLSLVLLGAG